MKSAEEDPKIYSQAEVDVMQLVQASFILFGSSGIYRVCLVSFQWVALCKYDTAPRVHSVLPFRGMINGEKMGLTHSWKR